MESQDCHHPNRKHLKKPIRDQLRGFADTRLGDFRRQRSRKDQKRAKRGCGQNRFPVRKPERKQHNRDVQHASRGTGWHC